MLGSAISKPVVIPLFDYLASDNKVCTKRLSQSKKIIRANVLYVHTLQNVINIIPEDIIFGPYE